MADKKLTDLGTPSGGVASGDKLYLVDVSDTTDNAAGSSRADTMANVITKGHGLADEIIKVSSGIMVPATVGTDYYAPGSTDVAVADGGTGASSAAGARTNLGLAIGTDVQAQNARLSDIAGITYAQGDVLYHNGSNIVNLAPGTAGQFLSSAGAGANPLWVTGALATYDTVVAASGGNYTSLSAAITAGETRIFVRDGTYTETTTINIPASARIIGESPAAIINLSTGGVLNFNGAKAEICNLTVKFAVNSTNLRINANDILIDSLTFEYGTTTNTGITFSNSGSTVRTRITNCFFDRTSSTGVTGSLIAMSGVNNSEEVLISGNIVRGYFTSFVAINANNGKITITGNSIFCQNSGSSGVVCSGTAFNGGGIIIGNNSVTMTGSSTAITLSCTGVMVTGNTIINGGTSAATVSLAGQNNVITGNYFASGGPAISLGANNNTVSGNAFSSSATGVSSTSNNQIINGNHFNNVTTPLSLGSAIGIVATGNSNVDALNTREVIRMKNTSGGTIAAGSLVVYKSVAAGDEITTTTSAGDNKVFGMAEAAINNNATGGILVRGKTVLLKVDGTTDIAIGDYISTFTTGGIGQKATAGQTAIAIALEAYTTDDSSGVIDALLINPRII